MGTTRSQGQLAGVVVLVTVLLALVLRRRHRDEAHATVPGRDAVVDAAQKARSASASTLGRAGEVAHSLLGEATGLLGNADVGDTIDKLQQAIDDARGALAGLRQ
jgi:hypothetical protein